MSYIWGTLNAVFAIINLLLGISDFRQHGHFWIFSFLITILGVITSVACFRSASRL